MEPPDRLPGSRRPRREILLAWQCNQQVRYAYATTDLAAGRKIAEKIVASFASCPIGESTRLRRTLRQWKATYLGSFTTERSNNGGTEAINGLIELHAHRPRLPQPRQLPTPHAPARR